MTGSSYARSTMRCAWIQYSWYVRLSSVLFFSIRPSGRPFSSSCLYLRSWPDRVHPPILNEQPTLSNGKLYRPVISHPMFITPDRAKMTVPS